MLRCFFVLVVLLCAFCPQPLWAQTIDFTSSASYPDGFPTSSNSYGEKDYVFTATNGEKVSLRVGYCGNYSDQGFLQINQSKTKSSNDYGRIIYKATSKVSSITVKIESGQPQNGKLTFLGGSTTIGEDSVEGDQSYTINIPSEYQIEGKKFTIKSTGTGNVRLASLTFSSASGDKPASPTFTPAAGTYAEGQAVSIAAATECSIYYTIDGTTPTYPTGETTTKPYSSALTLATGTTTVSAIAVDANDNVSETAAATYTITAQTGKTAPTFCFSGDADITVAWSDAGSFVAPTLTNSSKGAVTYSSDNTSVATVSSAGELSICGLGTAIITASVAETEQCLAATAQYTLHVVDYIETFELVTDASTLAEGNILLVVNGTQGSVNAACSWVEGRYNVDAVGVTIGSDGLISAPASTAARLVLGADEGKWTLLDGTNYWSATSGTKVESGHNYLQGSSTVKSCSRAAITIDADSHAATIKFDDADRHTLSYNANNGGTSLFACYALKEQDVYLFRQIEAVEIGSHGISSFSSTHNLDFSNTVIKPYTASDAASGVVTLSPVPTVVPARTGVMLRGTAGTKSNVPVINETTATVDANLLRPVFNGESVAASANGEYRYLFGTMGSETAFFRLDTDYTARANRCYLQTSSDVSPQEQEAKGIALQFAENGATSVRQTGATVPQKGIFTLSGQRLGSITHPGIYIVDGRKTVVK